MNSNGAVMSFLPSFRVVLDQLSSAETGVSPTSKAD